MNSQDEVDIDIFTVELHSGAPIYAARLRPAQLVTFYLMASYLYYRLDVSLMADSEYDSICIRLDAEWNEIKHPHKRLINRGALSATTGYYLGKIPLILSGASEALAKQRGLI